MARVPRREHHAPRRERVEALEPDRDLARIDCRGGWGTARRDRGAPSLRDCDGDAHSSGPASCPIGDAGDALHHSGPMRCGAAANRRAPPSRSRTCRGCRWRSGLAARSCGRRVSGWADLEKRTPVSPETRFRIGTASTMLTSAAVGLLVEKGQLKLDDEIQTYVPEFPKKEWPVTVRQLMGHVAGVRNDGGDEGPLLSRAVRAARRRVAGLRRTARCCSSRERGTAIRATAGSW